MLLYVFFIVCREIKDILGFKNHKTCMKEAALLDYYVCGFWWAKEASFSPTQTSFTLAVLHLLLDNVRGGEVTNQEVFTVASSCFQHRFVFVTQRNTHMTFCFGLLLMLFHRSHLLPQTMCYGDVLMEMQTGSNSNNRHFKCAFFLLQYFSRSESYLEVILHYSFKYAHLFSNNFSKVVTAQSE